jgi:hypothetical protein
VISSYGEQCVVRSEIMNDATLRGEPPDGLEDCFSGWAETQIANPNRRRHSPRGNCVS